MPKFLDDIKFIDSQGEQHLVSEYVPQIRTQGAYYTGLGEQQAIPVDPVETNIPDGEISKQGSYYTGLNADGSGNEQDGIIKRQGDAQNSRIINQGDTQYARVANQGEYYTGLNELDNDSIVEDGEISKQGSYYTGLNADGFGNEQDGEIYKQGNAWKLDIINTGDSKKQEVIDAGNEYLTEDGKIAKAQADAINAINAKGEEWAGDLDVDNIINWQRSHNNLENGEGEYSVKMKTETEETANVVSGISSMAIGDGNNVSGEKNLAVGGNNRISSKRSIVSGFDNNVMSNSNLLVVGCYNQMYGSVSFSAGNTNIMGARDYKDGHAFGPVNNSVCFGVNNKMYSTDRRVTNLQTNKYYNNAVIQLTSVNLENSSVNVSHDMDIEYDYVEYTSVHVDTFTENQTDFYFDDKHMFTVLSDGKTIKEGDETEYSTLEEAGIYIVMKGEYEPAYIDNAFGSGWKIAGYDGTSMRGSLVCGIGNQLFGSTGTTLLGSGNYGKDAYCSCAIGEGLRITSNNQFVVGAYNEETNDAFVVGAGGTSKRRNVFTVSKEGLTTTTGLTVENQTTLKKVEITGPVTMKSTVTLNSGATVVGDMNVQGWINVPSGKAISANTYFKGGTTQDDWLLNRREITYLVSNLVLDTSWTKFTTGSLTVNGNATFNTMQCANNVTITNSNNNATLTVNRVVIKNNLDQTSGGTYLNQAYEGVWNTDGTLKSDFLTNRNDYRVATQKAVKDATKNFRETTYIASLAQLNQLISNAQTDSTKKGLYVISFSDNVDIANTRISKYSYGTLVVNSDASFQVVDTLGPIYSGFCNTAATPYTWNTKRAATTEETAVLSTKFTNHISSKNNPHSVTKDQVGLGNVANYSQTSEPTYNSNNYFTAGGAYNLQTAISDQKDTYCYNSSKKTDSKGNLSFSSHNISANRPFIISAVIKGYMYVGFYSGNTSYPYVYLGGTSGSDASSYDKNNYYWALISTDTFSGSIIDHISIFKGYANAPVEGSRVSLYLFGDYNWKA